MSIEDELNELLGNRADLEVSRAFIESELESINADIAKLREILREESEDDPLE